MPGYVDWKLRNCPEGAITKAQSLLRTLDAVEPELHKLWDAQGECFTDEQNKDLLAVIAKIDVAEDNLESAKLDLARYLPGCP
jgi:hypothetical protein